MENKNNTNNDWSKRDIGALWRREGSTQKYLSGYIKVDELGLEKEVKVVVFSNKNKKNNEKAPDYRIYISKPLSKDIKSEEKVEVKSKNTKKQETTQVEDDESIL
jgi:uncharacterized protein (DUF736 family)